jgi:hypothetical protein
MSCEDGNGSELCPMESHSISNLTFCYHSVIYLAKCNKFYSLTSFLLFHFYIIIIFTIINISHTHIYNIINMLV